MIFVPIQGPEGPCSLRIRFSVRAAPTGLSRFSGYFPRIPSLRRLHPGLLSVPPSGRKSRVRAIRALAGAGLGWLKSLPGLCLGGYRCAEERLFPSIACIRLSRAAERKICLKGPVSAILRCSDVCGRARRSEGSLAGPCCAGDLPPFAWRTPDMGEGPAGNSPKSARKALETGKEM